MKEKKNSDINTVKTVKKLETSGKTNMLTPMDGELKSFAIKKQLDKTLQHFRRKIKNGLIKTTNKLAKQPALNQTDEEYDFLTSKDPKYQASKLDKHFDKHLNQYSDINKKYLKKIAHENRILVFFYRKFDAFLAYTGEKITEIIEFLKPIIKPIIDRIIEFLKPIIKPIIDRIIEFLKPIIDCIIEFLKPKVTKFLGFLKLKIIGFKNFLNKIMETIKFLKLQIMETIKFLKHKIGK
uniref:Uncharacterized protein n=1 Tax=Toxarium undulatum TaxID=210620 RepID=A0A2U9GIQ9_9STRA|nr:hypothetical protein [Toxarium undulatum]AWQ64112.1 hypothetical protein [Toxarium undulatum]